MARFLFGNDGLAQQIDGEGQTAISQGCDGFDGLMGIGGRDEFAGHAADIEFGGGGH